MAINIPILDDAALDVSHIPELCDLMATPVELVGDPTKFIIMHAKIVNPGEGYVIGDTVVTTNGVYLEIVETPEKDTLLNVTNPSIVYTTNFETESVDVIGGSGTGMTVSIHSVYAPGDTFITGDLIHTDEHDPLVQKSAVEKMIENIPGIEVANMYDIPYTSGTPIELDGEPVAILFAYVRDENNVSMGRVKCHLNEDGNLVIDDEVADGSLIDVAYFTGIANITGEDVISLIESGDITTLDSAKTYVDTLRNQLLNNTTGKLNVAVLPLENTITYITGNTQYQTGVTTPTVTTPGGVVEQLITSDELSAHASHDAQMFADLTAQITAAQFTDEQMQDIAEAAIAAAEGTLITDTELAIAITGAVNDAKTYTDGEFAKRPQIYSKIYSQTGSNGIDGPTIIYAFKGNVVDTIGCQVVNNRLLAGEVTGRYVDATIPMTAFDVPFSTEDSEQTMVGFYLKPNTSDIFYSETVQRVRNADEINTMIDAKIPEIPNTLEILTQNAYITNNNGTYIFNGGLTTIGDTSNKLYLYYGPPLLTSIYAAPKGVYDPDTNTTRYDVSDTEHVTRTEYDNLITLALETWTMVLCSDSTLAFSNDQGITNPDLPAALEKLTSSVVRSYQVYPMQAGLDSVNAYYAKKTDLDGKVDEISVDRQTITTNFGYKTSIVNTNLDSWGSVPEFPDPSPLGWRLPTKDELDALVALNIDTQTTINNKVGKWVGSEELFFPYSGYLDVDGTFSSDRNTRGCYSSSTPVETEGGLYYLSVTSGKTTIVQPDGDYVSGQQIRPVRDISTTDYEQCPAGEIELVGVVWAKSNVLEKGKFCENTEDLGGYFQFGQDTCAPAWIDRFPYTDELVLKGELDQKQLVLEKELSQKQNLFTIDTNSNILSLGLPSTTLEFSDVDPVNDGLMLNWTPDNYPNPCPRGWRVPTSAEYRNFTSSYEETTVDGVIGNKYDNGLFIPTTDGLNANGTLRGGSSVLWSATRSTTTGASWVNGAGFAGTYMNGDLQFYLVIRPVRDVDTTDYEPCPAGEVTVGDLVMAGSNVASPRKFCAKATDIGWYYKWGTDNGYPGILPYTTELASKVQVDRIDDSLSIFSTNKSDIYVTEPQNVTLPLNELSIGQNVGGAVFIMPTNPITTPTPPVSPYKAVEFADGSYWGYSTAMGWGHIIGGIAAGRVATDGSTNWNTDPYTFTSWTTVVNIEPDAGDYFAVYGVTAQVTLASEKIDCETLYNTKLPRIVKNTNKTINLTDIKVGDDLSNATITFNGNNQTIKLAPGAPLSYFNWRIETTAGGFQFGIAWDNILVSDNTAQNVVYEVINGGDLNTPVWTTDTYKFPPNSIVTNLYDAGGNRQSWEDVIAATDPAGWVPTDATVEIYINSMVIGDETLNAEFVGSQTRPSYNGEEVVLMSDVDKLQAEIDELKQIVATLTA